MSTYKLFYFNARGRAENVRLIFAQAGVKYEDCRFTGEEWAKEYKAKSPFGVAPWLEVDGEPISGSLNMSRFVGEAVGLAGKNSVENGQLASIADCYADMMDPALKPVFMKGDDQAEEKAKLMEKFKTDSSKWLDRLESRVNDKNFIFADSVTWVDIAMASGFTVLTSIYPTLLDNYPKLTALRTTVEALPNIAKWMKERPKSDF